MAVIQSTHNFFIIAMITMALGFSNTDSVNGQDNVIIPAETIELFNGEDLSGFYTWLVDHEFEDPDNVFSVVDRIDGAYRTSPAFAVVKSFIPHYFLLPLTLILSLSQLFNYDRIQLFSLSNFAMS